PTRPFGVRGRSGGAQTPSRSLRGPCRVRVTHQSLDRHPDRCVSRTQQHPRRGAGQRGPFMTTTEHERLAEIQNDITSWRRWGPYVGDRAWATVREDYSALGNAWDYLPHDLARSKAYRWGEDAIAVICDRYQLLCCAPAFWNGRDPILKERLFGLTPGETNHGEDVKEYYFHLDNTPTHSYMKMLYKYPQAEFPYEQLVQTCRGSRVEDGEFELIDT